MVSHQHLESGPGRPHAPARQTQPARGGRPIPMGLAGLWMLLLLLAAGGVQAARIETVLDRNPVPLNESFSITFIAHETPDGDPDFEPLNGNFEVLGQSQSSQYSFNNGSASRTIEWKLSVMARREGTLDIPPIAFGQDQSEALAVTVLPAHSGRRESAAADIFLEVEAEPKNPYVQAQVIYTIRVLSRTPFQGDLGKPEADDAPTEKLDEDRRYTTTRNGVGYQVDERRYTIFPQKSGPFRIPPVQLEAQIPVGGGRSLFNQFFNRATRTERLQSEAVELEVRPIPTAFKGKHWLPAARLELEDSFDRDSLQANAGEPITRTLTLKGEGATVGVLPELDRIGPPIPAALKQYPDQPVVKEIRGKAGLVSVRQEKTALIAVQPGTYRLPALEVPWWNTQTDQPEMARLPERVLTVLPATNGAAPAPAEPAPEAAPAPPPAASPAEPSVQTPAPATFWPWLAGLFGLGWLVTALAWRFSQRRRPGSEPAREAAAAPSEMPLIQAIEAACRANDPAAARRALAAWGDRRWPGSTLDQLAGRFGGELGQEIVRLNRALYAPQGMEWRGRSLWDSFKAYRESAAAAPPAKARAELEPLYKL